MVEKQESKCIYYHCEVCGNSFELEQDALDCEKSKPKKIRLKGHQDNAEFLDGKEPTTGDEWDVGDCVIYTNSDVDPSFGVIVSTKREKHMVRPVIKTILGGNIDIQWGRHSTSVMIVGKRETIKKLLKEWLDRL